MAAKPVPDGFNSVSVYLIVKNVGEALELYQKAFGAEPGACLRGPDGQSIIHAEMRIGNSTVMLTEENPQWNAQAPETLGGSPASIHIYAEDADRLYNRAVEAGCEPVYPLMDAFWGDRYGKVKDPFGFQWGIATHKKDLSEKEIQKGAAEWFASMSESGCRE
jgi:uncharacterized glyoxalase superfamily protein PhnB